MENLSNKDFLKYFELKPVVSAKVSEISEKTASSQVPADERVNFHIGNPVQDERLNNYYLKAVTGLEDDAPINSNDNFRNLLVENETEEQLLSKLLFIREALLNSNAYLPSGGYSQANPNELIRLFSDWLTSGQQESLEYDIGMKGSRECIIASGGINESLRVFFFALSNYSVKTPVNIVVWDFELPEHLLSIPELNFIYPEKLEISSFEKIISERESKPSFLLIGSILDENTRRRLRRICLSNPLIIVEVNDAPNHLSLAREARMKERVIRFLSPAVFSPDYKLLSLVFVCGLTNFIKIIETTHFKLLGTPSGSEVSLLTYLLNNPVEYREESNSQKYTSALPEVINVSGRNELNVGAKLAEFTADYDNLIEKKIDSLSSYAEKYAATFENYNSRINSHLPRNLISSDSLETFGTDRLVEKFFNFSDKDFFQKLEDGFLSTFTKHHPEYLLDDSIAVSGSARTALGLLGFHCGIEEVVIPDLSWTYEHCFPDVNVIPLKEGLKLDDQAIISFVESKLKDDPEWNKRGAVIINNPHNASGKIFPERKLINLIKFLFENKVRLIDDLSYQNVAPNKGNLKFVKTLKQIADELSLQGYIRQENKKYLITVHSLSKTDCFAGARLSVINLPDKHLYHRMRMLCKSIKPNIAALFLAYLFYRNDEQTVKSFWSLRNNIFSERMEGITAAAESLPSERNNFDIEIEPPAGSMYPRLIINKLPSGLSLDWLASGLASQGIGMVPLSAFARTEKGFEQGRKTFRLTLGGVDGAVVLKRKVRRLIIDLNRLISEESAKYNTDRIPEAEYNFNAREFEVFEHSVDKFIASIKSNIFHSISKRNFKKRIKNNYNCELNNFTEKYLPVCLGRIKNFILESYKTNQQYRLEFKSRDKSITDLFNKELYKESIDDRLDKFKNRIYDRTVHPTQAYSLKLDSLLDTLNLTGSGSKLNDDKEIVQKLDNAIIQEYFGENVAIKSVEESDELLLDLQALTQAEKYFDLVESKSDHVFLSYWGDWDGSNRPSGQGHRLVASVVVENVNRLSKFLLALNKADKKINIEPELLAKLQNLNEDNIRFWKLLNKITTLTNQLEKRYKSLLPFDVNVSRMRKIGIKMSLASDPVTRLWQHNDRLEKRMRDLRRERSKWLRNYFELNKSLRKKLHSLKSEIIKNLDNPEVLKNSADYKNILNRFVLTPRIHQKLITSRDQFAIDSTVYNIIEINEIAGKYGNPGLVLALQVSMSTNAEALISLDRKLRARREEVMRQNPGLELPNIWIIPLFEDTDSVNNIENYLDKVWKYSIQSRRVEQEPAERFSEIICEVFIAGSDLSQQVGQTASASLYNEIKFRTIKWLADKGLVGKVRMKLGSGEPMQRQGGYYNPLSGKSSFWPSSANRNRLLKSLKNSTVKSCEYAKTPMLGVLSSGDLRTFQSNISETIRRLPISERSGLLNQIAILQAKHSDDLKRAAEPFTDTRLKFKARGLQELERLTTGFKKEIYKDFVELTIENFRNILYGNDEDVVGVHLISYFISRTTPTLRDRPTIRPSKENGSGRGQKILSNIARTIPMNRQGSSLRAIGHNRAQTIILGINQLTTGLFRSMTEFCEKHAAVSDSKTLLLDVVLPHLPVYEILMSLRNYHDTSLTYLQKLSYAFPAGNSSFIKLREDIDAMPQYIGLLQKELLRRQGVPIFEFFSGNKFKTELLPTLRPDLAVLLQPDLFNTSIKEMLPGVEGEIDTNWLRNTEQLLLTRNEILNWREKIWELLSEPIYKQVASFTELAIAINSLSSDLNNSGFDFEKSNTQIKVDPDISNLLKGSVDDNMRQFLQAAVQFLTTIPRGDTEIPVDIVRALKDVERILKVEEQALSPAQQKKLNFCILQIARLSGDNG